MKKVFTLFSLLLFAIAAQSQMRYFKGVLQGSQQVPANGSAASGVVIVKYNVNTRAMNLYGNYTGLASVVTGSHIHSPAGPGSNAPIIIQLPNTGGTTGSLSGSATLTPAQESDILAGLMYVNVHNANFPDGEIRAQLTATANGQTEYFDGRLQGAQQVPANASTGSGAVRVLVDDATDSVYLTGNFSGLSAAAGAAHIHNDGPPGSNGPVFRDLIFSNATSGTLHIAAPITQANIAQMMNGTTYVNIHNTPFPNGEIRAQLTKLSQMRFLKATLQGSQEVPANASPGIGTVIVKYSMATRLLELVGDYQNTTSPVNASHIHWPAAPGTNAAVLVPLINSSGTSGTLNGSQTLTAAQEADLLNGLMYVNVHTVNNSSGEIRGQLIVNAGESEYMTGIMLGSKEVPANTSNASGNVTVMLDRAASRVYVTGNFSGLTTPASAGHLHSGLVGVAGPVIVPLSVTAATAGTITGSGTVSAGFADSLTRGYTYANIHNATYSGGEIRSQLGNLALPLKLNYFNGYKKGNSISLLWETSKEINVNRYEIEQQDVNGTWVRRVSVAATGNNSTTAKYSYDDVPLMVKSSLVLYRLKMIDNDGLFTYSPVIGINFSQLKAGLSLAYNPVTNGVLLYTVTGQATDTKVDVMVADYNGRIVIKSTASALQNNRLEVAKLPAGIYKLIVHVNGTQLQESFSKQ